MTERSRDGLQRRDFLRISSACALYPAVWRVQSLSWSVLDADAGAASAAPLSVGYLNRSEYLPDVGAWLEPRISPSLDEGSRADDSDVLTCRDGIVSANSLGDGDRRFLDTGARVTIHGLYPDATLRRRAASELDLSVRFAVDRGDPVEFRVWSFESRHAANVAAPVSFHVPIDEDGLTLSVDREEASEGSREGQGASAPVQLGVGYARGTPKLRRGVYFLAGPSASTGTVPDLERYRFAAPAAPSGQRSAYSLVESCHAPSVPADFDYLLLSVEHGR
jgi:hypothetical protein